MCDAPARVWDIVNKGRIEVGYDADLVLVDMKLQQTVDNARQETKCRWSPWHGVTLQGWPVRTWVGGHEVFCEGKFDESRRGREAIFDYARGGYWKTR
jgi:dihydroorotase